MVSAVKDFLKGSKQSPRRIEDNSDKKFLPLFGMWHRTLDFPGSQGSLALRVYDKEKRLHRLPGLACIFKIYIGHESAFVQKEETGAQRQLLLLYYYCLYFSTNALYYRNKVLYYCANNGKKESTEEM
jgi:hypothetical protein